MITPTTAQHYAHRILTDLALTFREGDSGPETLNRARRRLLLIPVETLTPEGARTHAELSAMVLALRLTDTTVRDHALRVGASLKAIARRARAPSSAFIKELVELAQASVNQSM